MDMHRLHPAGEIAAEQALEIRHGDIEERPLAAGFELGGETAAEIDLDLRPAEWPHVIGGGGAAVGVPEQTGVRVELLGIVERQEQLVGEPQRQSARGFRLLRQRRREQELLVGEDRARQRHDRVIGGDRALRCFDLQTPAMMIDLQHRTVEHDRQGRHRRRQWLRHSLRARASSRRCRRNCRNRGPKRGRTRRR